MTVPSHAVGDVDDVDDRLDALRKRLARGSDVSVTVGTAGLEGRVSPERLSRESSKELSVPPAASGPRDERPPRPRRAEPVDVMPSPTARSPRPSSPRSSTTAATHRRWNAHYDVNTTPALTSPGRGRERAAAYGSPARFGIVPISPAPSLGVLAGDGDGRGRSIHDGRGDSTRHSTLRRHPRGDDLFGGDNDRAGRFATSIGDDVATVTMTLRERDEIHAKLVRLTGERDASRAECKGVQRDLSATTIELDRVRSRYADVAARLDAVAEDLATHRARVGARDGGGAGFVHPALAGATADARVAASELRAAVEDMVESIDPGCSIDPAGRNRVAGVVRERTRALIARAEDVAIAAMGEVAAAASREAATGGRRFKLPIY